MAKCKGDCFLKRKKAKLKKELEQLQDPADEEKLRHDIDFISKDIDEIIREERRHHKAGCERVKELNDFAFEQARVRNRRLQEVKSNVGHNLKKS